MVEPPRRLLCFEYRTRLPGGVTRPPLIAAVDEDGREYEIVLKLRFPDSPDGHYEGTSLACELICGMIARSIGVPVPDYAVVEVPEELSAAMPDNALRGLFARNVGDNFGSVYQEGYASWSGSPQTRSPVLLEQLEDVLVFDATVINGDRKDYKPNLLWRGESVIAIDHSLAIPCHLWTDAAIASSPLFPDDQVREHCTFGALSNGGRVYELLLERWRNTVDSGELSRMRSFVPSSWERRPGDLDKIFTFLGARTSKFPEVSESLRRILQ